jgi:hypothetical protein
LTTCLYFSIISAIVNPICNPISQIDIETVQPLRSGNVESLLIPSRCGSTARSSSPSQAWAGPSAAAGSGFPSRLKHRNTEQDDRRLKPLKDRPPLYLTPGPSPVFGEGRTQRGGCVGRRRGKRRCLLDQLLHRNEVSNGRISAGQVTSQLVRG